MFSAATVISYTLCIMLPTPAAHGDMVFRAVATSHTLYIMLHITGGHRGMFSAATVISYTLYIMLPIVAAHGDMVSGVVAISHTLCIMLHITARHADMVSWAPVILSCYISPLGMEAWFQGLQ